VDALRLLLSPAWLIAAIPIYLAWRFTSAFALEGTPALLVSGTVLVCLALIVASFRARRRSSGVLVWTGQILMGFISTLWVCTLLRDVVLLAAGLLGQNTTALSALSALLALAFAVAATLAGLIMARTPRIVRVRIPLTNLPKELHDFSIVQISDVHVGPTIKRGFVERVVRLVNALGADVVAVTGDLVDGTVAQLAHHTAPLAAISARHGAYFVTGNHEYYSGEGAWSEELKRLGLIVLKNQHVVLNHQGGTLVLAGVTDQSAHHFDPAQRSDPALALLGAPPHAGAKILLAHQPTAAPAAAQAGYDVQLSGHTHGGQFFPWNLLVGLFQPFTGGLHRLKQLWVYVSRGTGYWGPPNRFGVPAEVTHITLVAAP
jgi:predicted MPP superfamily phosphohydrolase